MMPVKQTVKIALAKAGMNLTDAVEAMNAISGGRESYQNLSKKIRTSTLRYKEAERLADALGLEIVWKIKEKGDGNGLE